MSDIAEASASTGLRPPRVLVVGEVHRVADARGPWQRVVDTIRRTLAIPSSRRRHDMDPVAHGSFPRLLHLAAALPLDGAVRIELEEGIPVFRASRAVQDRIEVLLQKKLDAGLLAAEEDELDGYAEMDDYLSHLNRVVRNQHLSPTP